jgi:adenine-specific DNA-methyltransferase
MRIVMKLNNIYNIDCLNGMKQISDKSINLIFTSPPYNIGKEYERHLSLNEYLEWQVDLINEYYRILADDGAIVYQIGNYVEDGKVYPLDCLLFNKFIEAGFIPRNRIVWTFNHGKHCTKRLSGRHETALWFTKTNNYTFNLDSIRVPQKYPNKKHYKGIKKGQLSCNPLGKNPGDVWDIPNVKHGNPEKTIHPCQFPLELAKRIVTAFSNEGDIVLDTFIGSGTTAVVCENRSYIGFETELRYIKVAQDRLLK